MAVTKGQFWKLYLCDSSIQLKTRVYYFFLLLCNFITKMIQETDSFKRNCDIVTAFQKFQYGRHWIYIVKGTPSKTFHYNIGYIYTKNYTFLTKMYQTTLISR